MFDLVEFGKRLKLARLAAGISQQRAAEEVGTCHSIIWKYEHGATYPPIDRVYDLAQLYGCSIDWLCGVEDDE